jgi:digeranylgeranylglycerophospholipid reductase
MESQSGALQTDYDVIIVGSGPGGSTAAEEFASEGANVIVLEKSRHPGFKLCSGGVPSRAVREFGIESDAIGHPLRGYHIYAESGNYTTVHRKESIAVYRTTLEDPGIPRFDQYLADRAIRSGAHLLNSARVVELRRASDSRMEVAAETPKGRIVFRAPLLIGADGFNSTVAELAGLKTRYRREDFATGIQQEFFVDGPVSLEYVYHFMDTRIAPLGFGWIYPKRMGYTVGLGVLASHVETNLTYALSRMLRDHPIVSSMVPKGARAGRIEAACIPMIQSRRMYADNLMLIGDAAGHVDAMGGDGIYFAMKAGRMAATLGLQALGEENLTSDRLSSYQKQWREGPGRTLLNQRQKLDAILGDFRRYWELQVFLNNRPQLKQLFALAHGGASKLEPVLPPQVREKLVGLQLSV